MSLNIIRKAIATNPSITPEQYNAQAADASSRVSKVLADSARQIGSLLPMEGSTVIEISVCTSRDGSSANGVYRVAAFLFEKTKNDQGKTTLKIDATYFKYGDVVKQIKGQGPLAIEEAGESSSAGERRALVPVSQERSLATTSNFEASVANLIPGNLDEWLKDFCGNSQREQTKYSTAIALMKVVQASFANGIPFPTLPLREGDELESGVKVISFDPEAQLGQSGRIQLLNIISSSSNNGQIFNALSGHTGSYHPDTKEEVDREVFYRHAEEYKHHLEVALGLRLPVWIENKMSRDTRGLQALMNSTAIGERTQDWDEKNRRIVTIMKRVAPTVLPAPQERAAIEAAGDEE